MAATARPASRRVAARVGRRPPLAQTHLSAQGSRAGPRRRRRLSSRPRAADTWPAALPGVRLGASVIYSTALKPVVLLYRTLPCSLPSLGTARAHSPIDRRTPPCHPMSQPRVLSPLSPVGASARGCRGAAPVCLFCQNVSAGRPIQTRMPHTQRALPLAMCQAGMHVLSEGRPAYEEGAQMILHP